MNFAVIDTNQNKIVNVIVWDGVAKWDPPKGCVAVQSDTLNIGDSVQQTNSVWQKAV